MAGKADQARNGSISGHYERLGSHYDELWEHSTRFRDWMCDRILELAPCPPGAVIADVGGGTGIYADALLNRIPGASVFVVDPASNMLAQVPKRSGLYPVQATAALAPQALAGLNIDQVDLLLIKEAVHHFTNLADDLAALAALVSPGRYLLIVMLPKTISYPLFREALSRFTELQPDPADVARLLTASGLTVHRVQQAYHLTIPTHQWVSMIKNRFMSLLSTFTDAELTAGAAEIEQQYGDREVVAFNDSFEFLVGQQS